MNEHRTQRLVMLICMIGAIVWSSALVIASAQENRAKLKVELTLEEWNVVMEVINQSSAPHNQVVGVQQTLIEQLQPQLEQSNPQEEPLGENPNNQ